MEIKLPEQYHNNRYTIDYLTKLHATTNGMNIQDVTSEILALLSANGVGMEVSMFYYYRRELQDSERKEMSAERLAVLSEYFEVTTDELITKNVIPRNTVNG